MAADPVDRAIAAAGAPSPDLQTARVEFGISSETNPMVRPVAFEIPMVLSLEEETELFKALANVLHQMRPHRPQPGTLVRPPRGIVLPR